MNIIAPLPPESPHQARHARMLQVAGDLFTTMPYEAVSMDMLAEAVPVSKRTLYNHFADKQTLFIAVMRDRCRQIFAGLEAGLLEDDVAKALTQVGRSLLTAILAANAMNIYRTAINQASAFPDVGSLFYASGPERSTALLAEYFRNLDARRKLCIPDPHMAAVIFLSMLAGRIQMRVLLGLGDQVTESEKEAIIAYAVELFLKGHAIS